MLDDVFEIKATQLLALDGAVASVKTYIMLVSRSYTVIPSYTLLTDKLNLDAESATESLESTGSLFVITKPLGKIIAITNISVYYVNTYVIEVPAYPDCNNVVLYTLYDPTVVLVNELNTLKPAAVMLVKSANAELYTI